MQPYWRLDSIAWTFNIRGADVTHTPVALAFALVHADGTADLFVEGEKIGDDVRAHLGNGVRLHERHEFESYLKSLSGKLVAVDPERSVAAISHARGRRSPHLEPPRSGGSAEGGQEPVEVAGHKAAQARDGAAVSRFLKWIEEEAPKGGRRDDRRGEAARPSPAAGGLKDLSFDTISAFGPNGALPHYKGTADPTCRSRRARSTWSIPAASIRTAPRTSPVPCRSASRPPR